MIQTCVYETTLQEIDPYTKEIYPSFKLTLNSISKQSASPEFQIILGVKNRSMYGSVQNRNFSASDNCTCFPFVSIFQSFSQR